MTTLTDYDELYEEFVALTSSPQPNASADNPPSHLPANEEGTCVLTIIKSELDSEPEIENENNCPFRALTPPSPILPMQTTTVVQPQPQDQQQQNFVGRYLAYPYPSHLSATEPPPLIGSNHKNYYGGMFDSSSDGTIVPNVVVSNTSAGNHLPLTSTSTNNNHNNQNNHINCNNVGLSFSQSQSLITTNNSSHQTVHFQHLSLRPVNHLVMEDHSHNIVQNHSHQAHSYHDQHTYPQHPFMEGQHLQLQQGLRQHQHPGPQIQIPSSLPPPPQSTIPMQQMIPFGIRLNLNNGGGNGYPSHQVNPYHGYQYSHQITNPQQQEPSGINQNGTGHNGIQDYSCYMTHASTSCLHLQQPFINSSTDHPGGQVRWMNASSANPPVSNYGNNWVPQASTLPLPSVQITSRSSPVPTPVIPDLSILPGGLERLWKEVPYECQRLMTPQDIPKTARIRRYFTVCELLILKRALVARLASRNATVAASHPLPLGPPVVSEPNHINPKHKEVKKRGPKRSKRLFKETPTPVSKHTAPAPTNDKEKGNENESQISLAVQNSSATLYEKRMDASALLAVSNSPTQDETGPQILTPHDESLLEHTDKGSSK